MQYDVLDCLGFFSPFFPFFPFSSSLSLCSIFLLGVLKRATQRQHRGRGFPKSETRLTLFWKILTMISRFWDRGLASSPASVLYNDITKVNPVQGIQYKEHKHQRSLSTVFCIRFGITLSGCSQLESSAIRPRRIQQFASVNILLKYRSGYRNVRIPFWLDVV